MLGETAFYNLFTFVFLVHFELIQHGVVFYCQPQQLFEIATAAIVPDQRLLYRVEAHGY